MYTITYNDDENWSFETSDPLDLNTGHPSYPGGILTTGHDAVTISFIVTKVTTTLKKKY